MSHFDTFIKAAIVCLTLSVSSQALAQRFGGGGGGHQLGVGLGLTTTSQEHLNTLISRANTRAGGISTGSLTSAYEVAGHYGYRFSGSMIAMIFRPSFFYQKSSGGNSSGSFNYGVTGFTLFPMLRLYPLENDLMKFFMQFGLGYGRSSSSIEEAGAKLEATGGAFGVVIGMGAEFCFTDSHCATVEGNYRYLTMERNIASSASGTWSADSLSNHTANHEVELDGDDLAIHMGGTQFLLGYAFHF